MDNWCGVSRYFMRKQAFSTFFTSAASVALPAFADARGAAAPDCGAADRAAIDRYLLPAGPTAANPPHAAAAGEWDRQRDGLRTVTETLLRIGLLCGLRQ